MGTSDHLPEIWIKSPVWKEWEKEGKPIGANAEFSLFTGALADALLLHNCCILHAAAIRFRDRAYMFTARSGVGKSTQVSNLQKEYPFEFSVICGDRPVLEQLSDGTFMVHPSPWNGKENWHGAESAPLAGIFCLERGEETAITLLKPKQAVIPVFQAFISEFETEETILKIADMESSILSVCPVYHYVNGGVPDSTHILYDQFFRGQHDGEI